MNQQEDESAMEQDQRQGLLAQEAYYYNYPNYLQQNHDNKDDEQQQPSNDLHPLGWNIIQECAAVVSDPSRKSKKNQQKHPSFASVQEMGMSTFSLSPKEEKRKHSLQETLGIWRRQFCTWTFDVLSSTSSTSTWSDRMALTGIALMDRYFGGLPVQELECIPQEEVTLVGMVCLQLAAKTVCTIDGDEQQQQFMEWPIWQAYSRGYYSLDDWVETERDVLIALEWRILPPIVLDFGYSIGWIDKQAIARGDFLGVPPSQWILSASLSEEQDSCVAPTATSVRDC